MTKPLATAILALTLFCLPTPLLAQTESFAPEASRLYLVAEGDRSAIPERILRSLCDLIKKDHDLLARFRSIGVYRVAGEARQLAEQRVKDSATARLNATRDLLESADRRFRDEYYCAGEKAVPLRGHGDGTASQILWLEWLGEPMGDELRAQWGRFRGPEPEDGSTLGEPRYVKLDRELQGDPLGSNTESRVLRMARQLGRLFLDPDDSAMFKAGTQISLDQEIKCRNDVEQPICAQLGAVIHTDLIIGSTVWLTPDEVNHKWDLSCRGRDDRPVQPNQFKTQLGARTDGQRVVTLTWSSKHRATCEISATLTVDSRSFRAPVQRISISPPPLLVRRSAASGQLLEVQPQTVDLRERRMFPWGPGAIVVPDYFEDLLVLPGEAIVDFGARFFQQLLQTPLPFEAASATSKRRLRRYLSRSGDLLGYEVLRDNRLSCDGLQKMLSRQAPDTIIDWRQWNSACLALLGAEKARLSAHLTLPSRLILRRDPKNPRSAYKGLSPLATRTTAAVRRNDDLYARRITKPYRPKELYLVHGVVDNAQSRAVKLNAILHPPAMRLAYGMGAVYRPSRKATWAGISQNAFVPFFDDSLSLRLEVRQLYPLDADANDFNLGIATAALLDLHCLARTMNGDASCGAMLLETGGGIQLEDITGDRLWQGFASLRGGYRIRTGIGDSGQEFRIAASLSTNYSTNTQAQISFEFSQL